MRRDPSLVMHIRASDRSRPLYNGVEICRLDGRLGGQKRRSSAWKASHGAPLRPCQGDTHRRRNRGSRSPHVAADHHLGRRISRNGDRTTGLTVELAALKQRAVPRDRVRADGNAHREPPIRSSGRRIDASGAARRTERDRAGHRPRPTAAANHWRTTNRLESASHGAVVTGLSQRCPVTRATHQQHRDPGHHGDLKDQELRPRFAPHDSYAVSPRLRRGRRGRRTGHFFCRGLLTDLLTNCPGKGRREGDRVEPATRKSPAQRHLPTRTETSRNRLDGAHNPKYRVQILWREALRPAGQTSSDLCW